MKNNGFLKTDKSQDRGCLWNEKPIQLLDGFRVEIEGKEFVFNGDKQKVFHNTTKSPWKDSKNADKLRFLDLLETVGNICQGPIQGNASGWDKYDRDKLPYKLYRFLYPPITLPPKGNEEKKFAWQSEGIKIIIPSINIDIWTRVEVLLGPKLSGQMDALTEASNLSDEIYKKVEIQSKPQYRKAPDKFSNS